MWFLIGSIGMRIIDVTAFLFSVYGLFQSFIVKEFRTVVRYYFGEQYLKILSKLEFQNIQLQNHFGLSFTAHLEGQHQRILGYHQRQ